MPVTAALLGVGGLIPFIVGTAYLWSGTIVYAQVVANALVGYGAVILSFLGAVHWGLYLLQPTLGGLRLVLGVTPSLIGWGAVLLALLGAPVLAVVLLIVGFTGIYMVDWQTVQQGVMPRWYGRLRIRLTAVVVANLIAAALTY